MPIPPKPPVEEIEGGWEASGHDRVDEARGSERAPQRSPGPPQLVRIGGPDRGPLAVVVAVVIFIAVAVVKPWPNGFGTPVPLPADTPPSTARPTVDPLAAIRLDCEDPLGWRVFSREQWSRGILRSWRTLEPARAAAGPLDPVIPDLPIGPGIVALGYCAVWTGPDRPPDDVAVHVWSVAPTGVQARPITLVSAGTTLHPPLGALFAPPVATRSPSTPPGPALPPGAWPPGTFVFEVSSGAFQRWWAISILDGPRSPSPEPSPTA